VLLTRNGDPDVKGGEAVVVRRLPVYRQPLTGGETFRTISYTRSGTFPDIFIER